MHLGEPIEDDRFVALVRLAYDKGIRTFLTADVYGTGEADSLLGWKIDPARDLTNAMHPAGATN